MAASTSPPRTSPPRSSAPPRTGTAASRGYHYLRRLGRGAAEGMDNVSDALRWGILGTGYIASELTQDLLATGMTITAVGSRTQESADAFAARYGIPPRHPT